MLLNKFVYISKIAPIKGEEDIIYLGQLHNPDNKNNNNNNKDCYKTERLGLSINNINNFKDNGRVSVASTTIMPSARKSSM